MNKAWSISNGQICINVGKDLIIIPDFYGSNSKINASSR